MEKSFKQVPGKRRVLARSFAGAVGLAIFTLFFSACSELKRPTPEPFIAQTSPPPKQEFKWSNGKLPKSFDPARAAAEPETGVIRAIFEGLTEIDSRSLKEIPAAAEKWTSAEENRVWTFQLRKDARWSNGKRVIADDFVTSWKRLITLGDKAANRELFQNIVGFQRKLKAADPSKTSPADQHKPQTGTDLHTPADTESIETPHSRDPLLQRLQAEKLPRQPVKDEKKPADPKSTPEKIGVEAVDDSTLKVTLEFPDKDFPKLVANPIFRPIYGDGVELESDGLDADLVTNGPFKVAGVEADTVTLERSDTYWNKASVRLETVKFIGKDTAEAALEAYKNGELDAVTNADFAPLALKLLSPYDDFRKTTHSALNYYEFNANKAPFNDRLVREAFAISIDRDRLTEGDMDGLTQAAISFLPLGGNRRSSLALDAERARQLMETAGYPRGQNFPQVHLLVNRNETQQRVAKAVVKMWKQNLGVDVALDIKDAAELETQRSTGEFDLVRRGIVIPTLDETVAMAAIFGISRKMVQPPAKTPADESKTLTPGSSPEPRKQAGGPSDKSSEENVLSPPVEQNYIMTEEEAMLELRAIPIYFPIAYSLVKPYVKGFEVNGLEAPLLKDVGIDNDWRPARQGN